MNLSLTMGVMNGGLREICPAEMALATSFVTALGVCIQKSRVRRTDANLAVSAGIHPAQFSRVRQGKAHLPGDLIPIIERLCGNTAITQWLALQHGAQLHYKSPEEIIKEQAEELAQLRAKVAA